MFEVRDDAALASRTRGGGVGQLTDVFLGQVVESVRPHRMDCHGHAWRLLVLVCQHQVVDTASRHPST